MKLRLFLLVVFIACCYSGFAQLTNIQFFNKAGLRVKFKDSAYFMREIREVDTGKVRFKIIDTYANGKIKLIGKSSQLEGVVLEGHCIAYYPNGVKQQEADYKHGALEGDCIRFYPNGVKLSSAKYKQGTPVGDVYNYFANGQLYTFKSYIPISPGEYKVYYNQYKLITCNDSMGNGLVINGNGYYVDHELSDQKVAEEGFVKDGIREGQWKGEKIEKDDNIVFTEIYIAGKMVKGTSIDKDNNKFTYKTRQIAPDYKYGMQEFYRFLSQSIQHPKIARENKVAGKVFVSFSIEKDGAVSEAKIMRAPNAELGAEALRVVQLSPNWKPGFEFERPVRVQFTVPINFNLTN